MFTAYGEFGYGRLLLNDNDLGIFFMPASDVKNLQDELLVRQHQDHVINLFTLTHFDIMWDDDEHSVMIES